MDEKTVNTDRFNSHTWPFKNFDLREFSNICPWIIHKPCLILLLLL